MKRLFILIMFVILYSHLYPQVYKAEHPLTHTYSIVARDEITGEMGVAVQSHWFSVGSVVSWGEAGVGVIATQSFSNVSFGVRGLELLKNGLSPQQALDSLLSDDEGSEYRQVAILDAKGRVAAHTGNKCIQDAGHITGDNFSVQANLMLNDKVCPAMEKAFKETKGPLAERMAGALKAAQEAGGDIRGKQSAAILVVKGESTGKIWQDRLIDLRVEDHPAPVEEIIRLLKVHRAYEHMNAGDLAVEKGDMELAMKEYSTAEEMFPGNLEMKYWHAVTLANNGKVEDSLPMFKEIFSKDKNWKILTPRLTKNGLLNVKEGELQKILEAD
ncbi:MAG: DUF1028 domain-containing protein [Ignavibacteriaceae bacterium]